MRVQKGTGFASTRDALPARTDGTRSSCFLGTGLERPWDSWTEEEEKIWPQRFQQQSVKGWMNRCKGSSFIQCGISKVLRQIKQ